MYHSWPSTSCIAIPKKCIWWSRTNAPNRNALKASMHRTTWTGMSNRIIRASSVRSVRKRWNCTICHSTSNCTMTRISVSSVIYAEMCREIRTRIKRIICSCTMFSHACNVIFARNGNRPSFVLINEFSSTSQPFKATLHELNFSHHQHRFRSRNKNSLREHMRTRHIQKPETCPICGKVSANKKALMKHKRFHFAEAREKYKCQVCGHGFRDSTKLKVWLCQSSL